MEENKKAAISSLIKLQSQVIGIDKDGKNPFFKSDYITYDNLIKGTRKALGENGFALVHNCEKSDNNILHITTTLYHVEGGSFESTISIPHDGKGHGIGSAFTYGKRYNTLGLMAICSGEDDDGNQATTSVKNKKDDALKRVAKLPKEIKDLLKARNIVDAIKADDFCSKYNYDIEKIKVSLNG